MGFVYRGFDSVPDTQYPDRNRILYQINWSAKEGFSGIELGCPSFDYFRRSYDREFTEKVRVALSNNSLQVSQFKADFLIPLLRKNSASPNSNLDLVLEKARDLSCKVVSFAASLIPSAPMPHGYLFPGGPPSRIEIPGSFSWSSSWQNYVESISTIADRARAYEVQVAVEPRPREMISSTDGLLSLFKEVGTQNLGALVNTAFLFAQREHIPLALRKLEGRIFATHLSDSDGLLEHHWAPGEGKIDWAEVIKAFNSVNYSHLHTLDIGIVGNPEFDFRQGKSFLDRTTLTMN